MNAVPLANENQRNGFFHQSAAVIVDRDGALKVGDAPGFCGGGRAKARMVASSNAAAGRDLFCFIPVIKLELHGYRLAIGLGGLEELARGEVEHSGKDVRGE